MVILTILFVVFLIVGIGAVVEEEGGDGTSAIFCILLSLGLVASFIMGPFGFIVAILLFFLLIGAAS
ncbi:hypothetical protein FNW02_06085 [Komarekiella sp. 'clone 1']|uniref:Uncharacterized protein n=1 Tax=Komarekiella delphini-convector SJRDD-AB1 TaxID=2593771 RepID=A0AA40SUB8_9NOST|nr:hypothetical protein [Komarekiella delphini-convector]MBD6615424.1 hypothetical protein [Komarekiella delphini-convector SJRDD-AB1]